MHVCLVKSSVCGTSCKRGSALLSVFSLKKTHARLVANACVWQSPPSSCSFQIQSVKQGGVVCHLAESVVGCREHLQLPKQLSFAVAEVGRKQHQ